MSALPLRSARFAGTSGSISGLSTYLLLSLFVVGCGSTNSADDAIDTDSGSPIDSAVGIDTGTRDSGNADGGGTDGGGSDTKTTDAKADVTPSDDAPVDVGIGTFGTKIADGDFGLQDMTSDGYAIVVDNDTDELKAIPIAGGTTMTIAATADAVQVRGKIVFAWHDVDSTTGIGGLTTWTAAAGPKEASTNSFADVAAASDDATTIAYTDAAADSGGGNLVLSALDGSGKKTLNAVMTSSTCGVSLEHAGSYFVSWFCEAASDVATVASFDTTGTKVILQAGAAQFDSVDAAGTKVFVISSAGAGSIVPIGGGTPVAIDTGITDGLIRPDGTGVVYQAGTSLKRASIDGTGLVTLVTTGVAGLGVFSPDASFITFNGNSDDTTGLTDLFLASTTTAGTPTTLESGITVDLTPGDFTSAFTADGTHALYVTDIDTGSFTGTLKSTPVAGGATVTLGTGVWNDIAVAGAKVVFDDGFIDDGTTQRADLRVIDTASTIAPKLLASGVDVGFELSPAKDKVVYTYNLVVANQGLYVGAIP